MEGEYVKVLAAGCYIWDTDQRQIGQSCCGIKVSWDIEWKERFAEQLAVVGYSKQGYRVGQLP